MLTKAEKKNIYVVYNANKYLANNSKYSYNNRVILGGIIV